MTCPTCESTVVKTTQDTNSHPVKDHEDEQGHHIHVYVGYTVTHICENSHVWGVTTFIQCGVCGWTNEAGV